jgi:hypothetical protein
VEDVKELNNTVEDMVGIFQMKNLMRAGTSEHSSSI